MVRERVPKTPECQERSSGWEDKESLEDFWESIERLRRSPRISTIISTLPLKVTCSRTRMCWLKPSTRWSKRRLERSNSRSKERLERSRLVRRRARETIESKLLWVSLLTNQKPRRIELTCSDDQSHKRPKPRNLIQLLWAVIFQCRMSHEALMQFDRTRQSKLGKRSR